MFEIEYKKVDALEEVATEACAAIRENDYRINMLLAYELSADNLIKNKLMDVHNKAVEWDADECPKNLYFNHGQFKVGAVDNIVSELKKKNSSNRALYSLIDQETIMDSGDKPIPSFMIFQSILDGEVLYCNVYFRALEVSNFLRINLEEIRLNIESIGKSSLNFTTVRLSILSCRAHHVPNFNALERPKLDLLSPVKLCLMLQKDKSSVVPLIREMAEVRTSLNSESIGYILDYVEGEWQGSNKNKLVDMLKKTIENIDELELLRREHSHHDRLDSLTLSVSGSLKSIAEEVSK
jgi:thymidylate synthase